MPLENTGFELTNVSFANKGDELMVCALLDQLRIASPGAVVGVPLKSASAEQRSMHGLQQVLRLPYVAAWGTGLRSRVARSLLSSADAMLPAPALNTFGVVSQDELLHVFDCGGFAYGDPWGWERSEYMARLYEGWAEAGRKIVLLPKTFGPFTDRRIGLSAARIVRASHVAFARDAQSQQNLGQFGIKADEIPVFPDYTLPVQADPSRAGPYENRACLIPNMRMLDKTSRSESAAYVAMMASIFQMLQQKGLAPFILLMQHAADAPVAKQIEQQVGSFIETVKLADPRQIKGIIGACSLVVSSRLHGCICALGQAVPCIATGWNHKYVELYRDFDAPDLILRSMTDFSAARSLIDQLSENTKLRRETVARLQECASAIKAKNQLMWKLIFARLGSRGASSPALDLSPADGVDS